MLLFAVWSLGFTPRLHFFEAGKGAGMRYSDEPEWQRQFSPNVQRVWKLHWLLLSQLLTSQRCVLKTSDARGSRRVPHCLNEGTLTDLSGGFSQLGGRGGWTFFLFSLSNDCAHGWLLTWLFIVLARIVWRPGAFFFFFYHPFWNRRAVDQCPILRVTSTSPRALWLSIPVRLTGPRLWLCRGAKTWRGPRPDQPSALILDRPLSPPRLVRASPVRCHTRRIRLQDFHPTW